MFYGLQVVNLSLFEIGPWMCSSIWSTLFFMMVSCAYASCNITFYPGPSLLYLSISKLRYHHYSEGEMYKWRLRPTAHRRLEPCKCIFDRLCCNTNLIVSCLPDHCLIQKFFLAHFDILAHFTRPPVVKPAQSGNPYHCFVWQHSSQRTAKNVYYCVPQLTTHLPWRMSSVRLW